jgi:hypothetical protein
MRAPLEVNLFHLSVLRRFRFLLSAEVHVGVSTEGQYTLRSLDPFPLWASVFQPISLVIEFTTVHTQVRFLTMTAC